MSYSVYLIANAEEDLLEIYRYVSANDSEARARKLIEQLKEKCYSLIKFPHRGHTPPELERIDVYDFWEIHHKSYKIIYQIIEDRVFVHCILDGRRGLLDLLHRRLLR